MDGKTCNHDERFRGVLFATKPKIKIGELTIEMDKWGGTVSPKTLLHIKKGKITVSKKGEMNKNRIIGKMKLLVGWCPACNSDAPGLYSCPVCEYSEAPKVYWWIRFLRWREGKASPTLPRWER